jgi:hypothetical protein
MKINELLESATAGATSSGSIASVPSGGAGGNLLGGPVYKGSNPFKKKSKKKTENIIKRVQP